MTEANKRMIETLRKTGIPAKEIECYGCQIVITAFSEGAAKKWAALLGKFARVRGLIKSTDETKVNKGSILRPTTVDVFRVFAVME